MNPPTDPAPFEARIESVIRETIGADVTIGPIARYRDRTAGTWLYSVMFSRWSSSGAKYRFALWWSDRRILRIAGHNLPPNLVDTINRLFEITRETA